MSAPTRRLLVVLTPILVGIGVAAAAWFRLPDIARGTIWAEDGKEFLQQALDGDGWLLFQPYAGYLQFAPRVVAELVVLVVPTAGYALAMCAAACLITGLLAAVVFVCAREFVPNIWLRLLLASVTGLLPTLPHEVLGNMANIHWVFLWAVPWMLLARPRTRGRAVALGALAAVAGLTEIQVGVFLPLFLVGWRDRHVWWVRAGLVAGVVGQLIATALSPRGTGDAAFQPARFALGYLQQVVLPLYDPRATELIPVIDSVPATIALGLLGLVPFAALAGFALARGSRRQRILVIALLAGSILLWTASVTLNGLPTAFSLQRYGVVPAMLLFAAAVVGLQVLIDRWVGHPAAGRWTRWRSRRWVAPGLTAALAVLLAGLLVASYVPDATRRNGGPVWADDVATASRICADDRSIGKVKIATGPLADDAAGVPQWIITVHCDRI